MKKKKKILLEKQAGHFKKKIKCDFADGGVPRIPTLGKCSTCDV